jgi:undecaprenyl-diphosphatase
MLWIGGSQALAFLPGVSRSGISIITALFRNMNRQSAVRLSFLLSIPIVGAAGGKAVVDLLHDPDVGASLFLLLLGFFATTITGYVVIRFFLRFVERRTFSVFVLYRILLACALLLFLL